MSNRLAEESSLYLRQHADNPVDWMPWGEEAFARAKEENKPVLVSIGYSSCHWCHVMAHESFENDYIARLMNKHFVCIKVDREERPDRKNGVSPRTGRMGSAQCFMYLIGESSSRPSAGFLGDCGGTGLVNFSWISGGKERR